MKVLAIAVIVLCFVGSTVIGQTTTHPYSNAKPISEPIAFGSGVISTGDYESHPAFTPDGKTLYFLRSTPNFNFWTILFSRFERGRWSEPNVATFSGQYSDADPFITVDGSKLFFISTRPTPGKENPDLDIWYVEKTKSGWGAPVSVGAPVNSTGSEWYPTVAANGTLYFGSDRAGGKGRTDLYRSKLVNGKYSEPENLGDAINTQFNEFEPWIAPDESYLIFMCGGRQDARGGFDLYISYNQKGAWTKPVNMGDKINSPGNEYSPMVSPDGKYFFWSSTRSLWNDPPKTRLTYRDFNQKLHSPGNGLGDIYQIDLAELKIAHPSK